MIADDTRLRPHRCKSEQKAHKSLICFDGYTLLVIINYTIHMYSGITSGRVLDGELLYTKILEVN